MTDSWGEVEERDFAKVMEVGKLERMPAIRLYRRCRGNLDRALAIAAADAPTDAEVSRRAEFAARMRLRRTQNAAESQAAD